MSYPGDIDYSLLRSKGVGSRHSNRNRDHIRKHRPDSVNSIYSRTAGSEKISYGKHRPDSVNSNYLKRGSLESSNYSFPGKPVVLPHNGPSYWPRDIGFDNKKASDFEETRSKDKKKLPCCFVAVFVFMVIAMAIIVIAILVNNSTDASPPVTIAQPSINDTTTNTLTLVFTNTFTDMSQNPSTAYSVIVSTSDKPTSDTNDTWAYMNSIGTQIPYVAIHQCADFFVLGDKCGKQSRGRRQSASNQDVTAVIGKDICDPNKLTEYCNGALSPNKDYFITMKAGNGTVTQTSQKFGPFKTATDAHFIDESTVTMGDHATTQLDKISKTITTTSKIPVPTAPGQANDKTIQPLLKTTATKSSEITTEREQFKQLTSTIFDDSNASPTIKLEDTSTFGQNIKSTANLLVETFKGILHSTTTASFSTMLSDNAKTLSNVKIPTESKSITRLIRESTKATTNPAIELSTRANSPERDLETTSQASAYKPTSMDNQLINSFPPTLSSSSKSVTDIRHVTTTSLPASTGVISTSTTNESEDRTTEIINISQPPEPTGDPPLEIEEKDDYSIDNAGTWGVWTDFSTCSVTCDRGYQSRTRVCETSECSGTREQVQDCNTTPCQTDIYGTWSMWTIWGTCSVSCDGGSQLRSRVCHTDNGAVHLCVGSDNQTRTCNDFSCPNCSMACPNGNVSPDCTHCECNETFSVQVFSSKSVPLIGVQISPRNAPDTHLATTGSDGRLTISNQCLYSTYVLKQKRYIDLEVNGDTLKNASNLVMRKIEPLVFTKQPQDQMRLVGESVILCVEVTGNVPADYFEWFKEGVWVENSPGGTSSTLELTAVPEADSASYSCRASNDHNAIRSNEAQLTVKASRNDFCLSTPHSSVIQLPDDCLVNGNDTFDVGICPPTPCRSFTPDNMTCVDPEPYCCGPVSYSRVDVPCEGNLTVPVLMVTQCGCVMCPLVKLLQVAGYAGSIYGIPLIFGEIISNGTLIMNTRENGKFVFDVPAETERLVLLFREDFGELLLDTIYVLDIPPGANGVQYIKVKMLEKGKVHEITSSESSKISFSSPDTGKSIAEISIPPNAFYTENGTLYNGTVKASFGVIDPANLRALDSSPGDFTATDEAGNNQQMETFGMFSFDFESSSGERLSVPGDINVKVTADQIGNDTDSQGKSNVKLWKMNTVTGKWEFEDGIVEDIQTRKKRQINSTSWGQKTFKTTVRGLPLETTWFNFDAIRMTACYSKIRVYKNDKLLNSQEVKKAIISVVVNTDKNVKSISKFRAQTDSKSDDNGYCIIHACKSPRKKINYGFQGWIFGDYSGQELIPVDPTESISGLKGLAKTLKISLDPVHSNTLHVGKLDLGLVQKGPFYDWEGFKGWRHSKDCSNAGVNEPHFKFFIQSCEYRYNVFPYKRQTIKNKRKEPKPTCALTNHYKLWFNLLSYEMKSVKFAALYIKVHTPGLGKGIKIKAVSTVDKSTPPAYGTAGEIYGVRSDCPHSEADVTCIEVKGPTDIACSKDPNTKYALSATYVLLTVKSSDGKSYTVSDINQLLELVHSADINDGKSAKGASEFRLKIREEEYGPMFGLYWGKAMTQELARYEAISDCLAGKHGAGNGGVTSKKWAVQFN